METTFLSLCQKSVVSVLDGTNFGQIGDICINTQEGVLTAIVLHGRPRFFGFFGRGADTIIPMSAIKNIGKDVILVNYTKSSQPMDQKTNVFDRFFS